MRSLCACAHMCEHPCGYPEAIKQASWESHLCDHMIQAASICVIFLFNSLLKWAFAAKDFLEHSYYYFGSRSSCNFQTWKGFHHLNFCVPFSSVEKCSCLFPATPCLRHQEKPTYTLILRLSERLPRATVSVSTKSAFQTVKADIKKYLS